MATAKPKVVKVAPRVFRPPVDRVIRVKDGDTVDLMLDLGYDTFRKQTVRLVDIDTPEIATEAGRAVAEWLTGFLNRWSLIRTLYLDSRSYDKYGGRVLGDIIAGLDGPSVSARMLAHGVARRYDGAKRLPWTEADLAQVLVCSARDPFAV